MNKKQRYMQHARNVALMSDFKKFHIGCIAVLNGKILSVGFNSNKTHPIQQKYNKYRSVNNGYMIHHKLHAEIHCLVHIMDLDIPWNKVELYIYRITKIKPYYGLARPCDACMALIKQLGIKKIYYTTETEEMTLLEI